ncbi:MurR/RpiR family transcriptional regulator [Parapusillimonas granuli]|uniref:MurR/RpiR family transcriptional regulator n=1 Tax=Parapusillimonas granuli TaxID=380911 RepID=A0A853FSX3_9BURK|nr:MurR/RpiR family transcriptional regulator [Parapusillimonas granuli]MBB5214627.1 DNA-binding MurR/RpiR family transcriptional regulator [Parapusillimonas granuli]NYT48965.1 MurR/RpiR family transcriptional regulator [Parapusillimonas granuli]
MKPNADLRKFLETVAEQFQDLSKQLQRIAVYLECHQSDVAFQRVQDVATACSVHPSAVVRFAQRFGFSGYSELQAVFRDSLRVDDASSATYAERIRREAAKGRPDSSAALAHSFIQASKAGLDSLSADFDAQAFEQAVDLLAATRDIYVVGMGRSLSVASYLAYALQNLDKRAHFVSGVGGDPARVVRAMEAGDTLLAISAAPYAPETRHCLEQARARGARALLITDTPLAPICALADVKLFTREQTAFAFRTLTSTICLAQALFIALAYRLEGHAKLPPDDGQSIF